MTVVVPTSVVLIVGDPAVVVAGTKMVIVMDGLTIETMTEISEGGATEVAVHAIRVITTAGKTISRKVPEVCF